MRAVRAMVLMMMGLGIAACAAPVSPPSPILRNVKQVNPDGAVIGLKEGDLTVFQRYIRGRLPRPPAAQVTRLFLLEVDVPEGSGEEGAYMVVAFFAGGAGGGGGELEYFEQTGHTARNDRYFHRRLMPEELAAFRAFIDAHPVESLRVVKHAATGPAADTESPEGGVTFRYTDAQLKEARTVEIVAPGEEDRPAIELVRMFSAMRDRPASPPFVCSYILAIPVNADILFAEPMRHVLNVWYGKDEREIRAEIYPPLEMAPGALKEEALPAPQWYAYRGNEWVRADAPPVSTPPPARAPATAPATSTAPAATRAATYPARRIVTAEDVIAQMPGHSEGVVLPREETWRCETGPDHTTVWHYLPLDEHHGQWLGFVVPVLVFDDAHMQVDKERNVIYLVHDGQLIALPIPPSALMVR